MVVRRLAVLFLLAAAGVPAQAQAPDPLEPVRFLEGRWSGPGEGRWGDFVEDLEVVPILRDRVLEFRIEKAREQGNYRIRGLLTIDPSGRWRGAWYDQDGFASHYRGRVEPGRLLVLEEVEWSGERHLLVRRTWRLEAEGRLDYRLEAGEVDGPELLNHAILTKRE